MPTLGEWYPPHYHLLRKRETEVQTANWQLQERKLKDYEQAILRQRGLVAYYPAINNGYYKMANTLVQTEVFKTWIAEEPTPVTQKYEPAVWSEWATEGMRLGKERALTLHEQRQLDPRRQHLIRCNRARSCDLKRKQADRRAEILLLEHLDERQRQEWARGRRFTVLTQDGLREYEIRRAVSGNITIRKAEQDLQGKHGRIILPGNRLCFHGYHPEGAIPPEDHCLAQLLMLSNPQGEQELLAGANIFA